MNVELQDTSRPASLHARSCTARRLWGNPFSALFLAGFFFMVTIYISGPISQIWVEDMVLRPGIVAAMGANPNFDTFQGTILQKKAFQDPKIFPLYGSSEMSLIYDFQPARIFTPETGFTPFLIGKGGSQTLIHVLNLAALGKNVRGRKLAIFLSPQWYRPGGISQSTFAGNFSALHAYEMLRNPILSSKLKQEIAKRLLQFPGAYKDFPYLKIMLTAEAQPGRSSRLAGAIFAFPAQMEYTALILRDAAKTAWHVCRLPAKTVARYTSNSHLSKTPVRLDWPQLLGKAIEEGKKSTNNNPFEMDDSYYLQHIAPDLQKLKNSDKNAKLFPSPGYDDLKLLLKVLQEEGATPLFVIIPMNGRWYDYTGFSRTERNICYKKLAQIIRAKGFSLANFSAHEYDNYFLRDPWHLAWEGWIKVDNALDQFYR